MGSAKHDQRRAGFNKSLKALIPFRNPIRPRFDTSQDSLPTDLRQTVHEAIRSWLGKTPSRRTRVAYWRDLSQFLDFMKLDPSQPEMLLSIHPSHVAAWRDAMKQRGYTNATIRRRMIAVRALYSYFQLYGYVGSNPAHSKLVKAPTVPRDGKTVGLSSASCRLLLDAPDTTTPSGIRDRAILAEFV